MKISKDFKKNLVEQFTEWIDENVEKGNVIKTMKSGSVIVFEVKKDTPTTTE